MLNFAEQTGSGAVIVVWSLLYNVEDCIYIYTADIVDFGVETSKRYVFGGEGLIQGHNDRYFAVSVRGTLQADRSGGGERAPRQLSLRWKPRSRKKHRQRRWCGESEGAEDAWGDDILARGRIRRASALFFSSILSNLPRLNDIHFEDCVTSSLPICRRSSRI
jgi:hypothetical protein